jgi:NAD-dependent SIR2 family protein deacetylase
MAWYQVSSEARRRCSMVLVVGAGLSWSHGIMDFQSLCEACLAISTV